MKGTIYLIPTPLGEYYSANDFPQSVLKIIGSLKYFIVEDEKTARRFLKRILPDIDINKIKFYLHNEHTTKVSIREYIALVEQGTDIGILSESGCPAVADPGSEIVANAHIRNIKVSPLPGPSSVIMAIMSSGLNGQNFAFNGYLPVKSGPRKAEIRRLEKKSIAINQTQVFIETPYRNIALFKEIIETCHKTTQLCIAASLTQPDEFVSTRNIACWRKEIPDINKKPAVFLILGENTQA